MKRIAVLASGNGSNLQALIHALHTPNSPVQIALVLANVESAYALTRAKEADIPAFFVPGQANRQNHEASLLQLLEKYKTDFVCLAGFMRLLSKHFLSAYPNRVLNVHPSLLPSFPGKHAPQQALLAGVKLTGCTVHLVDEGVDTGPILAQAAVPILENDDVSSLTSRIQQAEHHLYPHVVRLFAEGRFHNKGPHFFLDNPPA